MAVRSAILVFERRQVAGDAVSYTVPSGVVALIKSVVITNRGTATPTVLLVARPVSPSQPSIRLIDAPVPIDVEFYRDRWAVLEAGYQLNVNITQPTGTVDTRIWVSGAELVI